MPKYLLKFVSEELHAKTLTNGKLFMRPASYYHSLELGQGDIREGALSHNKMIYMNNHFPIYCLYSVEESEIENGFIKVLKKCIDDFHCQNGYAVVLDYEKFVSVLPTLNTYGYKMNAGEVQYHVIRNNEFAILVNNKNGLNLFIKHPFYVHQKEYRLVVFESLPKECDHKEYSFESSIESITNVVKISSCDLRDEIFMIPIKRKNEAEDKVLYGEK